MPQSKGDVQRQMWREVHARLCLLRRSARGSDAAADSRAYFRGDSSTEAFCLQRDEATFPRLLRRTMQQQKEAVPRKMRREVRARLCVQGRSAQGGNAPADRSADSKADSRADSTNGSSSLRSGEATVQILVQQMVHYTNGDVPRWLRHKVLAGLFMPSTMSIQVKARSQCFESFLYLPFIRTSSGLARLH